MKGIELKNNLENQVKMADQIKLLKNSKNYCELCLQSYEVKDKKIYQIFDTFCLSKENFDSFIE